MGDGVEGYRRWGAGYGLWAAQCRMRHIRIWDGPLEGWKDLGCRMDPSGWVSSLGDKGVRTQDTGRGMFDMGCGMGTRQGCQKPFWQTWSHQNQAGLDPGLGGRA